MANERYSSQRNYVSQYERNTGITQGNNFSGRVVESLQNAPPSGHDVQDIVWGPHGVMNAPRDTVDGMVVSHRTTSTLSRSDVRSYRTSEMISPTESECYRAFYSCMLCCQPHFTLLNIIIYYFVKNCVCID